MAFGERVPESICRGCGEKLTGAGSLEGFSPVAGAVTFCAYCGAVMIFTDDLHLRAATPEEIADCEKDPIFLAHRAMLARMRQSEKAGHN